MNGIRLLDLIREHGPVSRATLAKLSGLSKPAVSEQVARLIRFGAAVETGRGEAGEGGGKRPTLLKFHAAAGWVAGIAIDATETGIALADLQGQVVRETKIATNAASGPGKLRDRLRRSLRRLLAGESAGIRAIGIGVPGRVDCESGILLEPASFLHWKNADFRAPLEDAFRCPVRVDNDVNVALEGELHRGAAMHADAALLIRSGTGVGAAVAIGRRIHHGAHWAAGEIGLLSAGVTTVRSIGSRGELESLLGVDQVTQRVHSAARRSALLHRHLTTQSAIAALFAAAREGDAAALAISEDVSRHASLAVASQVLAYDPDVVLVSGELLVGVIPELQNFLSGTVPWSPKIHPAAFGEEGVLVGAVDTALAAAYQRLAQDLSAEASIGQRALAGA